MSRPTPDPLSICPHCKVEMVNTVHDKVYTRYDCCRCPTYSTKGSPGGYFVFYTKDGELIRQIKSFKTFRIISTFRSFPPEAHVANIQLGKSMVYLERGLQYEPSFIIPEALRLDSPEALAYAEEKVKFHLIFS